jgi:hypothetical protein
VGKRYIVRLTPHHQRDAPLYLNGSHNVHKGTTHIFECAAMFKTEDEAMGLLDQVLGVDYYRRYSARWELLEFLPKATRSGEVTSA